MPSSLDEQTEAGKHEMKKQGVQIEVSRPRNESKSDVAMERLASMVARRLAQGQTKRPEEMTTAE